jgi:hypothetical protein
MTFFDDLLTDDGDAGDPGRRLSRWALSLEDDIVIPTHNAAPRHIRRHDWQA